LTLAADFDTSTASRLWQQRQFQQSNSNKAIPTKQFQQNKALTTLAAENPTKQGWLAVTSLTTEDTEYKTKSD
jgi:hypothetical protein